MQIDRTDSGQTPAERLEYLRGQLRGQCISWGELNELQGLAEHIEPGDVELLEAAGVPEFEAAQAERFALHITLGNEAMQTPEDVARALREVAERLDSAGSWDVSAGNVRDANGNTVGGWDAER